MTERETEDAVRRGDGGRSCVRERKKEEEQTKLAASSCSLCAQRLVAVFTKQSGQQFVQIR